MPLSNSQIDEAILSVIPARWVKVAFVIATVEMGFRNNLQNEIELDRIERRIEALIQEGHLAAQGNVKNWRHSEVRNLDSVAISPNRARRGTAPAAPRAEPV